MKKLILVASIVSVLSGCASELEKEYSQKVSNYTDTEVCTAAGINSKYNEYNFPSSIANEVVDSEMKKRKLTVDDPYCRAALDNGEAIAQADVEEKDRKRREAYRNGVIVTTPSIGSSMAIGASAALGAVFQQQEDQQRENQRLSEEANARALRGIEQQNTNMRLDQINNNLNRIATGLGQ